MFILFFFYISFQYKIIHTITDVYIGDIFSKKVVHYIKMPNATFMKYTHIQSLQIHVERLPEPYGDCVQDIHRNSSRSLYEDLYPVNYSIGVRTYTIL